ncbi:MAG: hypothetical protein QXU98_07625 [Candidatus Parvarchaeota archaeon]
METVTTTERDYSKLYSFRLGGTDIVVDYLRKLPEAKAKETYDRLLTFLNEIGSDAASPLFWTIADTKAVDILTDPRILNNAEFMKKIGSDATVLWLWAIVETKAVDILTDPRILNNTEFVNRIGSAAAGMWFWTMAETKAVDVLTDQRILNNAEFVKKIENYEVGPWFMAIAKTRAVSLLTSERILKFVKFASEIGSYAAWEWPDAIAKVNTKGKKWSDYYLMIFDEISKKPSQYMELRPIKDEKILEIAIENWDGKSRQTQLERYSLASAMQRLTVDYSKIFGGKLEDAENYCNEVLNTALKGIGLNQPEKFTLNEKPLLLNSKLNKREIDELNEVITNVKSNGYVIGVQNLSKTDQSTQERLSLKDAVKYLVLGLNGTRDPDKKEDAKRARDWLMKTFPDVAGKAINQWNRIRKEKMKELSAAYNEFEKNPTQENAEKVFNIFKGKENEALDNIAVNTEALTKNYIVGNYIISFEERQERAYSCCSTTGSLQPALFCLTAQISGLHLVTC